MDITVEIYHTIDTAELDDGLTIGQVHLRLEFHFDYSSDDEYYGQTTTPDYYEILEVEFETQPDPIPWPVAIGLARYLSRSEGHTLWEQALEKLTEGPTEDCTAMAEGN